MQFINYLTDNNLIKYCFIATIPAVIAYFVLKPYFNSTEIPDSPQTFNFTHDQIKEMLDRGEELNQETRELLDEDFQLILGEEQEMMQALQDLFSNLM